MACWHANMHWTTTVNRRGLTIFAAQSPHLTAIGHGSRDLRQGSSLHVLSAQTLVTTVELELM